MKSMRRFRMPASRTDSCHTQPLGMYELFKKYSGNMGYDCYFNAGEHDLNNKNSSGGYVNPKARAMYSKLKVYKGPNHPHTAQQPQALDI